MQEQLAEIVVYLKGIIRRRWIIIITAWIISIGGWGFIHTMPDKFTSTARVHVDTRTMLRPLLRGIAIQADVRGLVAIMKKLMFTQQNMLKIAELAGIKGDYQSENGRYLIVNNLKSKLEISGGRDEIFSISFEDTNPLMSQKVVQAVLSVFSEQTQQSALNDVGSAQRFIEEQIREYEQRLRNAEKARENFKKTNLGLLPGQGGDQIDRMQAIKNDLEVIKQSITELQSKKMVLQAQLNEALESDEEWGLTDLGTRTSAEEARISSLEEKRDELLFKYTEKHPNVLAIDSLINELRKKQEEKESLIDDEPSFVAMSSPYAQTIKISLNNMEAELATLNSRKKILTEKLQEVDEQFNSRLAIETEMQNLNRDYESVKRNYLQLIERREQASMSEKVDTQASALTFKIVDPANRPTQASAPKRPLLFSVVFLFSIALGGGVALVMVLIRPVFTSATNLRSVTGLPVLGSVSVYVSNEEHHRLRLNNFAFFGVSVVLVTAYSGLMVLELFL
jgi:protein tyrosine kinase modulator